MTNEITEDASTRICKHMNDDHSVSIFAMVSRSEFDMSRISHCRMTKLTSEGCSISFVYCNGNVCEQRNTFIKFSPPITSVKEVRKRLIELHHEALAPQFIWLLIDPIAIIILILMSLLACGVYGFASVEGFSEFFQGHKNLLAIINFLWGSASALHCQVIFFWYLAVSIHFIEALYVAFHSIRTLKLRIGTTMLWFYLVLLTGYPIAKRFLTLLKAQKPKDKSKLH